MKKLRVLPVQCLEIDEGVLLKRGNSILNVNGTGAKNAVQTVLASMTNNGSTVEEITNKFTGSGKKAVSQLIDKLIANRFVIPVTPETSEEPHDESHSDVFYWHFGETSCSAQERLSQQRITILGVNTISRELCSALWSSGFHNFEVIDCPTLRNGRIEMGHSVRNSAGSPVPSFDFRVREFEEWRAHAKVEDSDCFVATSDFGGKHSFKEWNQVCVKGKRIFFPILLEHQIGYAGPLVIPDQTACYECFLARLHSNQPFTPSAKKVDDLALEGQSVIGFHPAMAAVLANIAAFELTKFFSGAIPGWNVGTVLEINLLTSSMIPRKVLKIPRCSVCSPLATRPPINPKKSFLSSPAGERA